MEELLAEIEKLKQENQSLREQLMKKKDSETVVQLACGLKHSLALFKDGTIKGWGDNTYVQSINKSFSTEGRKAIQIACGQNHSMALLDDGTLRGWGNGNLRGMNKEESHEISINVLILPNFEQKVIRIICGNYYSCALLEDKRTVVTWGFPIWGEENTIFVYEKNVKQIECGGMEYFIVLFEDGTIKIHGYFRDPSIGFREKLLNEIEKNKEIERIACGWQFFLTLSDKKFKAYGGNIHIDSSEIHHLIPEREKNITHFDCGIAYCVVITNNKDIRIIGTKFQEEYINSKDPSYSYNYEKSNFSVESNVVHLACGDQHFIILLENGDFISYGLNDFGQCNKPAFLSYKKKYLKYKNKYLQLK